MITPRRTRLIRVPDLATFRRAIARLSTDFPSAIIVVPTTGAAHHLCRTIEQLSRLAGPVDRRALAPRVVTREGLYDLLFAQCPAAPRRLSTLERDSLAQAAAAAVARPLDGEATAEIHSGEVDAPSDTGATLPFRLRPALVAEMLRFYDQLRRQSQRLNRFAQLVEETLGGPEGDRGTARLLVQTRFLTETFREYERRADRSGGWDEHRLRDYLLSDHGPAVPPDKSGPFSQSGQPPAFDHVIVTVSDWVGEPDGLFVADFDLLSRLPGLSRLDLVCTHRMLESGFHERIHGWWPGLDEMDAPEIFQERDSEAEAERDRGGRRRPILEVPTDVGEATSAAEPRLWFTLRDREEELVAVAHHVKAVHRTDTDPPPFDRAAVVFKRPLPYLYLAGATLGAARIPFSAVDALPLAAEPFAATLDLVIEAVSSNFSRDGLLALLATPHLTCGNGVPLMAVRALDNELRTRGYIGDVSKLEALAEDWTAEASRPALDAALSLARELTAIRAVAPASTQLRRLRAFLADRLRSEESGEASSAGRDARVRSSMMALLSGMAEAHQAHHDPEWTAEELAAAVRRRMEEQTVEVTGDGWGVQLLDDRAARYGDFDDITIVGLIDRDWPEPHVRNIFYSPALLKALGWPSESTRRRAADARFLDLLESATRRVAISTIALDDEAMVMRSMQLDEVARLGLSSHPRTDVAARITADDALSTDPVSLAPLFPVAREWAQMRQQRPAADEPAFHGFVGTFASRSWSVSALETYLACPFKFFAKHVLGLEEEPEDSDVMDPRQQGMFVHRVFEVFFDRWRRSGRGSISAGTLDEAREQFAAVVEDELQRLHEAEAGLERTRLLGSPAAAGLGEAVLRMEAERPVPVVERLLEHRLDGELQLETSDGTRTVCVRGKVDRIELLEDGTFRLVDYKLGWPPQRSRALQLPIYGLAAERHLAGRHGKTWMLGEAAYLAFKGPKRVVPLFSNDTDRTKVLAAAQQRAVDTIDAIDRGEFPPTPDDVYLCELCSFASVCRKDYVGDV